LVNIQTEKTMAGSNYYVYQYITEDGLPYYIGKGSGTRIREHHLYTEVPPAERRIILKDGLTNKEAYDIESVLIKFYGCKKHGGILDNKKVTRWVAEPGWKHSDEAKKKISEGNTGKVRSEEAKANYRKPKTAEHAEKIRQANLGRPYDPVRAAKTSATLKARNKAIRELTNG
jgi:hypothetical protein